MNSHDVGGVFCGSHLRRLVIGRLVVVVATTTHGREGYVMTKHARAMSKVLPLGGLRNFASRQHQTISLCARLHWLPCCSSGGGGQRRHRRPVGQPVFSCAATAAATGGCIGGGGGRMSSSPVIAAPPPPPKQQPCYCSADGCCGATMKNKRVHKFSLAQPKLDREDY